MDSFQSSAYPMELQIQTSTCLQSSPWRSLPQPLTQIDSGHVSVTESMTPMDLYGTLWIQIAETLDTLDALIYNFFVTDLNTYLHFDS